MASINSRTVEVEILVSRSGRRIGMVVGADFVREVKRIAATMSVSEQEVLDHFERMNEVGISASQSAALSIQWGDLTPSIVVPVEPEEGVYPDDLPGTTIESLLDETFDERVDRLARETQELYSYE